MSVYRQTTRKNMKRFNLFTLLYLAAGVCLTAIALQHPDMTPSLKRILLLEAGLLYLFFVLSTFPFWHQAAIRSRDRLRQQQTWKQNLVAISPWLLIALALFSSISNVLSQNWTTKALVEASWQLPVILVCAESIFNRSQPQS